MGQPSRAAAPALGYVAAPSHFRIGVAEDTQQHPAVGKLGDTRERCPPALPILRSMPWQYPGQNVLF